MNIVYSSSDAYAECTGISLWSLYANNTNIKDLNVYILDTDITDENHNKLFSVAQKFNRTIQFIKAKDGFINGSKELNLPLMRGSYNTYSRVLLNTWFFNLDKILVIDSDTLVCGDISDLWNIDLTGKLMAAVPEVAMYGKYNNLESKDLLDSVPIYFNMGICLLNLAEWRKRNIDSLLKECVERDKPSLKIADQSLINMYLNDGIVRADLKFNYYSVVHGVKFKTIRKVFSQKNVFSEAEYMNAQQNPVIIHYFGHSFERPWFKWNAAYQKDKYLLVRGKTPWKDCPLQKWRTPKSKVLKVYDVISYLLLQLGLRDFCIKFRYVYGQRIKEMTGIHR